MLSAVRALSVFFILVAGLTAFAAIGLAVSIVQSPTSCTGDWSSCTNAFGDGSGAATAGKNDVSSWADYGFSLEPAATVDAVVVRADFFASQSNGFIEVRASNDSGVSYGPVHTVGGNTVEQQFLVDVTDDFAWSAGGLGALRVEAKCVKAGGGSNPTCSLDYLMANASITGAVCTRNNPAVTALPFTQKGLANHTLIYTVTITNADTAACGASTFSLDAAAPNRWTAELGQAAFTINPLSAKQTTLNITSPPDGQPGNYMTALTANATTSGLTDTGIATYELVTDADLKIPSACTGSWSSCNSAFADGSEAATAGKDTAGIWQNYSMILPPGKPITAVVVRADFFSTSSTGFLEIRVSNDSGVSYGPVHTVGGNTAEQQFLVDVTDDFSWSAAGLGNLRVEAKCVKNGGANPTCSLDYLPVMVSRPVCNAAMGRCHSSIQAALNNASAGHTLTILKPLSFTESPVINVANLKLIGPAIGKAVITGTSSGSALTVLADNVRIENLTVLNLLGMGIRVAGADNTLVRNVNVSVVGNSNTYGNDAGIRLENADNTTITESTIYTNSTGTGGGSYAIYLYDNSNFNVIVQNTIRTAGLSPYALGIGIENNAVKGSEHNLIALNDIRTNGKSFGNEGLWCFASHNNIWRHNVIITNGSDDNEGIILQDCVNNTIINNTVETHGTGIQGFGLFLGYISGPADQTKDVVANNTFTTETGNPAVGLGTSENKNNWTVQLAGNSYNRNSIQFGYPNYGVPAGGQLLDAYYVTVQVLNNRGSPLAGASVNISSANNAASNPSPSFALSTDNSGFTPAVIASSFLANATLSTPGYLSFNNYTVNIAAAGFAPKTGIPLNLTQTQKLIVQLQ